MAAAVAFAALAVVTPSEIRSLHYGIYSLKTFFVLLCWAAAFLYLAGWVLVRGRASPERARKLRALVVSLCLALLAGELFLRFVVGRYHGYLEENGEPVYLSQSREPLRAKLLRHTQGRTDHLWLILPEAHATWVDSRLEFTHVHRYNSMGLREREIAVDKPPGEYRIVAVGDSFTEGAGADEDSTWVRFLEKHLSAERPGRRVRAINGGLAASDPFYEYLLLRERLLAYDPDLVILAINSTDLDNVRVRGGMERFAPNGSIVYRGGPRWEWIYGTSYIARHVVHDVLDYDWSLVKRSEAERIHEEALDSLFEAAMLFDKLSRERRFDYLIVVHPLLEEIENGRLTLRPLLARLRERNAPVLDLYAFFTGEDGMPEGRADDYYWRLDGHHNARGYELFARGVASHVLDSGLLDR